MNLISSFFVVNVFSENMQIITKIVLKRVNLFLGAVKPFEGKDFDIF